MTNEKTGYIEAGDHPEDQNPEENSLNRTVAGKDQVYQGIAFDAAPGYDVNGRPDYRQDDETGDVDHVEELIPGSNPSKIADELGVDRID